MEIEMKRALAAGIAMMALFAGGATVSDVSARQRDPCNGLVDIDYTLGGETSGLAVDITVTDHATGRTYRPTAFAASPSAAAGTHRATWNPLADGLSIVSTAMTATVSLYRPSAGRAASSGVSGSDEGLYLVVDLSGGTSAGTYSVSCLSIIPDGGWTDAYKTSKLVLRRIPAGTFTMGSPTGELGRDSDEVRHEVTISKPFYVGVFEVTQRQWELVMGTRPSYFSNSSCYQTRPVECVSYNDIRGSSAGTNWPASVAVDETSFIGKLRAKTGLDGFDLPTEAQWEYACRAGTTTALNSGKNLTGTGRNANMGAVGRYWYNGGSEGSSPCATDAGTAAVGLYAPNAWGLYDMHGNVWEWCLDWYGSLSSAAAVDPAGLPSGSDRVLRGGSWYGRAFYCYCRSAYRYGNYPSSSRNYDGFRLCCSAGLR